jgi:hypothetical protein
MAKLSAAKDGKLFGIAFCILLIISLTVTAATGAGGTVSLPKTGQTTSYATGDDGDLQKGVSWPNPRFTVGTGAEADCVTDNLTGLMWVKSPDSTKRTWQQALDYASGLMRCGYSDWRLPNRKELRSLVDYSKYNPALPTGHPFLNVQSVSYWSAATGAGNTDYAWDVHMWYGYVGNGYKTHGDYYVWPVRAGQ